MFFLNFIGEFFKLTKEWAPLILAFIGILISWKSNKLANDNSKQKKEYMEQQKENENRINKKARFNAIYKDIYLQWQKITNENQKILDYIGDKSTELTNQFSPGSHLSMVEFHRTRNLYFWKKVADMCEKSQSLEDFVFLSREELDNTNDLIFECLSCRKKYSESFLPFLIQAIKITRVKLADNERKHRDIKDFITPEEYEKSYAPYLLFLRILLKELVNFFRKISVKNDESIKIIVNRCGYCQKRDFKVWWKEYFPKVNFEEIETLVAQNSQGV